MKLRKVLNQTAKFFEGRGKAGKVGMIAPLHPGLLGKGVRETFRGAGIKKKTGFGLFPTSNVSSAGGLSYTTIPGTGFKRYT